MTDHIVELIFEDDLDDELPVFMTKYEYTKIIQARCIQISSGRIGSEPRVELNGIVDPYEIVLEELRQGVCPIIIRRKYPDGTEKKYRPSEMIIQDY